jgi:hypothetical protein
MFGIPLSTRFSDHGVLQRLQKESRGLSALRYPIEAPRVSVFNPKIEALVYSAVALQLIRA